MMIHVSIPAKAGNDAARNGTLGSTIEKIVGELKPEAAYFTAFNGERTCFLFVDMKDNSQMPGMAEPFFLAFNARVAFYPTMSPADLAAAGPGIERAVKEYGGL
jgi:hypothetical protein